MRDDGVISLIGGIIAVLTGVAVAVVTVVAVRASRSSTDVPPLFITVTDASGTRDAQGHPHVQVKYRVGLGGNSPQPFLPETQVRCVVVEAADRARTFEARAGVFLPEGASRDGALTVTPPASADDLEGAVRVRCDAALGDRSFVSATVPATVPSRRPDSGDASQYQGVYQVTMTLVDGILLNCEAQVRHRTFTVTSRGSAAITVEVTGTGTESLGISAFDATLTKTAQFSGEVFLIPGESGWQGLLSGGFSRTASSVVTRGRFRTDDGHCTYDFEGFIVRQTDAGVFAISLEDIPGVDGCQPVLAADTAKPGRVRFKVTNNTFGFAQIFIYDGEHNLTATNGKAIAQRGGTVLVSADLVAGTYDVQCDGPGAEDKTVHLTVG